MMKKILIMAFSVVAIILIANFLPKEKINNDINVDINENVEYKIYGKSDKKKISEIDYDDIKNIDISKTKFERIMDYKEYMGTIEKIEDLKDIKRFTEKDIENLKKYYIDSNDTNYSIHNINEATKEELRYLGLNNKSIKKIKEHDKITNMIELQELIGDDFDNIKGGVIF